jgi:formylglycine-generating enzyme required for sulfatase activity/predicted Ser/Thr protein kinase
MIGSRLLHYTVEAQLGHGGMGTVYRARDTLLNRTVAIKVLELEDREATQRLLHEARAASALNHPGSVTIHGVEQHAETAFIVMEYVDGRALDRLIPPDGLPVDEVLRCGIEIADAIAAAHEQGIVHRDIKPGNVMMTAGGRLKVLDFGIARRTPLATDATQTILAGTISAAGAILGTPGYMAPEQITGSPAGPQSDVFALGALLYQMVTGRPPFTGESVWATLDATVRRDPPAIASLRPGVPPRLAAIVARALAKNPDERYRSAREIRDELAALREAERGTAAAGRWRPGRIGVAAALVVALAITGIAAWFLVRASRVRWARDTAVPEVTRLAASGDPVGAYRVAQRALTSAPDDPQVSAAWNSITHAFPLASEPSGATVAIRSLAANDEGWIVLGTTPFTARVPFGQFRWRFSKEGFDTREIAPNPYPLNITLVRSGSGPQGMVPVPPSAYELDRSRTSLALPGFWIDTYEVTNRDFKAFIDSGGYQKRDYWTQPIVSGGRTLSWNEAMALFRDRTGRPGPSTWDIGSYPDGRADWPVSGVSWYEAAAYTVFAGKTLPTVYQWRVAAGTAGIFSDMLQFSNFGGPGPAGVGVSGSLGPYGTHDMAGNVKEWVWNESSDGKRFVLGGAWFEARHQFLDEDARAPLSREPGFGFRCMRASAPVPPDVQAALTAPIVTLARDLSELKPVNDDVYKAYRGLFEYDRKPLDSRVEERDDTNAHWSVERVSFTAAYGSERVPLVLFLPRSAKPPYQVAIYFPGSDATRSASSRNLYTQWLQFLVRSGRAVAFPIYQQTYERRRQSTGPNFLREISLHRGLDLRRTVDYLETRADIDRANIAFYGISLGAQLGPVYLAIEPRLKTGVLLSGGFETWTIPPEVDPVNFAPRVTQPVLMVNGREDFDLPYDTAQVPMFNMLGTPAADKRHVVMEGGHIPPRPEAVFKEILDWLDRYLGPVTQ